jgi:hypothetical protein
VMACGTIRAANVRRILDSTGVSEVHGNLQSLVPRPVDESGRTPFPFAGGRLQRLEVLPETVAAFLAAATDGRSAP